MSSRLNFRQRYQLLLEERSQYVNSFQQSLHPGRQKVGVQKLQPMWNPSFPMDCVVFVRVEFGQSEFDVWAAVFPGALWYSGGAEGSPNLVSIFGEQLQRCPRVIWNGVSSGGAAGGGPFLHGPTALFPSCSLKRVQMMNSRCPRRILWEYLLWGFAFVCFSGDLEMAWWEKKHVS